METGDTQRKSTIKGNRCHVRVRAQHTHIRSASLHIKQPAISQDAEGGLNAGECERAGRAATKGAAGGESAPFPCASAASPWSTRAALRGSCVQRSCAPHLLHPPAALTIYSHRPSRLLPSCWGLFGTCLCISVRFRFGYQPKPSSYFSPISLCCVHSHLRTAAKQHALPACSAPLASLGTLQEETIFQRHCTWSRCHGAGSHRAPS